MNTEPDSYCETLRQQATKRDEDLAAQARYEATFAEHIRPTHRYPNCPGRIVESTANGKQVMMCDHCAETQPSPPPSWPDEQDD